MARQSNTEYVSKYESLTNNMLHAQSWDTRIEILVLSYVKCGHLFLYKMNMNCYQTRLSLWSLNAEIPNEFLLHLLLG